MINLSKRILILCEDEKSSKMYFESFKRDERLKRNLSSVTIEVFHPKNHDPVGLVTKAKEMKLKAKRDRNPYNEIWIVLDKNGHVNIDQALITARDNKINVGLSVVCFEFWILLHFEKTTRSFDKCDDVIRYIKKKYIPYYEKKINYYDLLKDKITDAINNAGWLQKQVSNDMEHGVKIQDLPSYTNVHLLVNKLIQPEKIKGK